MGSTCNSVCLSGIYPNCTALYLADSWNLGGISWDVGELLRLSPMLD